MAIKPRELLWTINRLANVSTTTVEYTLDAEENEAMFDESSRAQGSRLCISPGRDASCPIQSPQIRLSMALLTLKDSEK